MNDQDSKLSQEGPKAITLLACALLLAMLIHGYFLAHLETYRGTYDAYTHIFFASKYKSLFNVVWVYNWFEGFELVSYPPLAPQLIALVGRITGLENAYILVQLVAIAVVVTGAYRFCRLWSNPIPSAYAAFSASLMTSVAQQVHQFGQLPTCFACGLALHASYHFAGWCSTGKTLRFIAAALYLVTVALSHHLTFFLLIPVLLSLVWVTSFTSNFHNSEQLRKCVTRGVFFVLVTAFLCILSLYPFIDFVLHRLPPQLEIPHATRSNYFLNFSVLANFFIVPMASTCAGTLFLPILFLRQPIYRPLILGFILLAILGLGGSTPIPKFIFGHYWSIFTFDRFAAWAALLLLPIMAWVFYSLKKTWIRMTIVAIQLAMLASYFHTLRGMKFQPSPVDLRPASHFLRAPENKSYRYLTLGLGSQLAKLSYMTSAPTVDGLYFTARTTKILRESGIESIDSAKYFGNSGKKVLDNFLAEPEKYSLRFVVVNDSYYEEVLKRFKWRRLQKTFGTLSIWETDRSVKPLPSQFFVKKSDTPAFFQVLWSFGVLSFFFALIMELYLTRVHSHRT